MVTLTATVQDTEPPRVQVVAEGFVDSVELLVNGGFEDGTSSWVGGAGIDVWNGSEEGALPAAEGGQYAHAQLTATGRQLVTGQVVNVTAGTVTITVQGATATADDLSTLELYVSARAGSTAVGEAVTDTVVAADAWQSLTVQLPVPEGADNIWIRLYATAGAVPLDVMFDDAHAVVSGTGLVTLYREIDGSRSYVRGIIDVTPTGGALVAVDNGAPFNVEVYYVLVMVHPDGSTEEVTTGPVVLTSERSWLSNPITGQGAEVTIAEWTELVYSGRRTVIDIAGRRSPIVVSDVRSLPASELVLYTATEADLRALREILAAGDVIQMRPVCDAVEPAFIAVGEVREQRQQPVGPGAGSNWARIVTLEAQEVDQPAPELAAVGDTLMDLYLYVPTTLADLAAAFPDPDTLLTIATTDLTSEAMV